MSALLVSMLVLLQSGVADAPQFRPTPRENICDCSRTAPPPDIIFSGVAIDAELRANASGRGAEPRQATIFRVINTMEGSVENPAKVWHITDTVRCGLRFDYGRVYLVLARKAESGIETDACLMSHVYRGAVE